MSLMIRSKLGLSFIVLANLCLCRLLEIAKSYSTRVKYSDKKYHVDSGARTCGIDAVTGIVYRYEEQMFGAVG